MVPAVDMGSSQSRKQCATPDCGRAAIKKGKCQRCYKRAYYKVNRIHVLELAKKSRQAARIHGPRAEIRILSQLALSAAMRAEAMIMELASKIGLDPATLPRDINSVVGLLNDMLNPSTYGTRAIPHTFATGPAFSSESTSSTSKPLL